MNSVPGSGGDLGEDGSGRTVEGWTVGSFFGGEGGRIDVRGDGSFSSFGIEFAEGVVLSVGGVEREDVEVFDFAEGGGC